METWHSVEVQRIGRAFHLVVDGQPVLMESFTQGSFIQLTVADNLYVGGHPSPDQIISLPLLHETHPILSYFRVIGFTGSIQSVSDTYQSMYHVAFDMKMVFVYLHWYDTVCNLIV